MKFLTEKDLEICEENHRLNEIYHQKLNDWEKEFSKANTDEEQEKTRPLFKEAEEARIKWQQHSDEHKDILRMDRLD